MQSIPVRGHYVQPWASSSFKRDIDTTRACPKESNLECVRPQAKLHEEQLKEMKIFGVKKKRKMKKITIAFKY